ncbi:hypothetical protein J437_LFUL008467 [Ladona fulva]|uniref:Uncharacterized protein n=1 Tax=Ladona fulva TaxID=123851 RepID=A0A8K0P062_LADFU|nr:hypothetical protein J437_LFUL008467 [Ladona fulva]
MSFLCFCAKKDRIEKEPEDSFSSKNAGVTVITRPPVSIGSWDGGTTGIIPRSPYPLYCPRRDVGPASPIPRRKFPMGVAALMKTTAEGRRGDKARGLGGYKAGVEREEEEEDEERWREKIWEKNALDLAANSNVQDAFVIAVEQQARERLERLSALKRIKPVDMTKLSQQVK